MFTLILMEYENSLPDIRDELTMTQAFRELKQEHKQKIKDLAFSDNAVYTVKTESAFYKELLEFIK